MFYKISIMNKYFYFFLFEYFFLWIFPGRFFFPFCLSFLKSCFLFLKFLDFDTIIKNKTFFVRFFAFICLFLKFFQPSFLNDLFFRFFHILLVFQSIFYLSKNIFTLFISSSDFNISKVHSSEGLGILLRSKLVLIVSSTDFWLNNLIFYKIFSRLISFFGISDFISSSIFWALRMHFSLHFIILLNLLSFFYNYN